MVWLCWASAHGLLLEPHALLIAQSPLNGGVLESRPLLQQGEFVTLFCEIGDF